MNTFLESAKNILKKAQKPLHYKEITRLAIEAGLKTEGKTPWASMNAQIAVDIQQNGEKSLFYRSEPGFYGLSETKKMHSDFIKKMKKEITPHKPKVIPLVGYQITSTLNTKQKGDITEARVAELITLYGEEGLSCYRPISDDEGIDIIVKKRGEMKVAYIQVKSTFGDKSNGFVSTVKEKQIFSKRGMLMVFVYFDITEGDLHEHVFCIPAPDFLKLTHNDTKKPGVRVFSVGLNKPDQSKYAPYLIEKRELANKILEILNES